MSYGSVYDPAPVVDHHFWIDLYNAVLEIAEGLDEPSSVPLAADRGEPLKGIRWKGSTQVLAWLLRELAQKGWIEAPVHAYTSSRHEKGDIIASRYAKAMAPHFADLNVVTLERELKPQGTNLRLRHIEGFKIPQKP